MTDQVKSGKEIVADFFKEIEKIEGVDLVIAQKLVELYASGKLTDTNIKNALQLLRENDDG